MCVIKLLHSADWHLGAPLSQLDPDRADGLRRWLDAVPQWVAEVCRREQCDLMLLSGDLLDGQVSPTVTASLKQALAQAQVPVFISPGNHDHISINSPWVTETWPENVHIFTRPMMEAVTLEALSCRVYGAGFTAMDCPGLLEGFSAAGDVRHSLAVLHGDPTQVTSPCNPVTRQQAAHSGLQYLALGHIHKAGSFRAGKTLCGWPGCPQGRGYDETGEKGVYIVTLDETAHIRFVPCPGPRFHDLSASAQTPPDTLLPPVGNGDFYRITLTGEGEPSDAWQTLSHRFPNLVLRDQTAPPMDLWGSAGTDTFEGMYFRLLQEAMENATEADAELIRLAARISRQLINGQEVALP